MSTNGPLRTLRAAGLLAGAFLWCAAPAQGPGGTADPGQAVYTANCVRCHGADGTKHKWGAKDLHASILPPERIQQQVSAGKGIMPSFKKKLTPEQLQAVARYVLELRKP